MNGDTPMLDIQAIDVAFGFGARRQQILHRVSLRLKHGQTLGLVGESGCGKSTLAKAIVGVVRPAAGRVLLGGVDVSAARKTLHRRVQMIPQDPYSSLSPRMTVGETLAEAIDPARPRLARHRDRVLELLECVALDAEAADRYPHEFSGGQRQRVAIARALGVRPDVIIADEITSALDCSVQAEVLNLLRDLRARLGLTMLFISHDLAVVRHVSDEVAVMQHGRIVEMAPRDELFAAPKNSYTRLLLDSIPSSLSQS